MSDIKKICEAMAALAAAIPGAGPTTMVSLHGCESSTIRMLVAAGGRRDIFVSDDCTHEWDCVSLYVGAVQISAHSKHRPTSKVEIDRDAVAAALAQADEALR